MLRLYRIVMCNLFAVNIEYNSYWIAVINRYFFNSTMFSGVYNDTWSDPEDSSSDVKVFLFLRFVSPSKLTFFSAHKIQLIDDYRVQTSVSTDTTFLISGKKWIRLNNHIYALNWPNGIPFFIRHRRKSDLWNPSYEFKITSIY